MAADEDLTRRRQAMVRADIARRGIQDEAILEAMRRVPRHRFVPERVRMAAYEDRALPIGAGQTISQPYIVARMAELARVTAGDKVLDVGTGSGYAAAVLAEIGAEVVTVEVVAELAEAAARRLAAYPGVTVVRGDATRERLGEFDAILVAAATGDAPPPLEDQLADGGRLVIPLGSRHHQHLWVIERRGTGLVHVRHEPVAFVPLVSDE